MYSTFTDRAGMLAAPMLAALMLAACGQRPPEAAEPVTQPTPSPAVPPAPPPPAGDLVQLTVVSAEIQGQMANGAPWDSREQGGPAQLPRPLARYLEQHPEIGGAVTRLGVPMEDEELAKRAQASAAVDPMIVIEVGDGPVFRSPVMLGSFTPLWDFSFRLVYGQIANHVGVERGALARIHVFDYDGPTRIEPIGTAVVPMSELLAQPVVTLEPFGGVTSLVLQARVLPLPPDPAAVSLEQRVAVPGKGPWIDTGIVLQAGQRVLIRAADEVCTGSDLRACSGPEGQRQPDPRNNLPGFLELGHGALVAAVGDARFAVQRELGFVAPASGSLLLGVNDHHVVNNSGSYAAHIVVYALP
jgi:hypothetical protein